MSQNIKERKEGRKQWKVDKKVAFSRKSLMCQMSSGDFNKIELRNESDESRQAKKEKGKAKQREMKVEEAKQDSSVERRAMKSDKMK